MSVETIWAREIDRLAANANIEFWDVRAKTDYEKKHLKTARNVPYLEYDENPGKIEKMMDRNKIYILYCDRGGVSMAFARELDKKGYHVKSVLGGLTTYRGNNIWEATKSND